MTAAADRAIAEFNAAHGSIKIAAGEPEGSRELVLRVSGVLDTDVSMPFRAAAVAAMDGAGPVGKYALDLSGLLYISSTGIGALTLLLSEARKRKAAFALRDAPRPILNVIDAMGFTPYFSFEPGAS